MTMRRFPAYVRSNPAIHVSILCVTRRVGGGGAPVPVQQYVLKVGLPSAMLDREGTVYGALAGEPRIVPCVYSGAFPRPYVLGFLAAERVCGRAAAAATPPRLSPEDAARMERDVLGTTTTTTGEGPPPRDFHAVITKYDDQIVSMAQCAQMGPAVPALGARCLEDSLNTMRDLYNRKGFVHFDLHNHNQLVDLTTGHLHLIDLDYSVSLEHPTSPIYQILPIAFCTRVLNELDPDHGGHTQTDLGHMYDLVLVVTSHEQFQRQRTKKHPPARGLAAAKPEEGTRAPPTRPPTKGRVELARFRACCVTAKRLVESSLWEQSFRRHMGATKYERLRKHARLLLVAAILASLYVGRVPFETVRQRLRQSIY